MDDGAFGRRLAQERLFLLKWLTAKYKLQRCEAEDCVHDALLKAWEARHTYEDRQTFRAWVMVIMVNHFLSGKRRAWRLQFSDDMTVHDRGGPANQFDALYLKQVLAKLLELPLDQIDAVVMISRGDQYDAAAELVGIASGTMKSRVARGRRALKEAVE